MFRYNLLWGNTAAPSWLYARLCRAFLVFFVVQIDYYCIFQHILIVVVHLSCGKNGRTRLYGLGDISVETFCVLQRCVVDR